MFLNYRVNVPFRINKLYKFTNAYVNMFFLSGVRSG